MESPNNNINNNDNVEDINENSVEYRVINQYGKNNNILNKIYYTKNEEYKTLMDFIKPYALDKDSPLKSNITCPGGRYNIAQSNFARFSELLHRCAKNKLILHFRELQCSDLSKKIGSGLMFDFDLLQTSEKNELLFIDFTSFLRRIFCVLSKILKITEEDSIHMGVIAKKTLVYKEDKKKYKNGFHVLIPSIKISRQAKKLIYHELVNDERLQSIYKSTFHNDLKETFDSGSYSVPTFFIYNCKETSIEPYELLNVFKVSYSDGLQLNILNKEHIVSTYNIITEFSLNFDSDLIVKKYYELQDIYQARVLETEAQSNKFEDEKAHVISTFNTYESYVDEYLTYYKKIVLEILDINRATDRNLWRDTIFAIANINVGLRSAFKPIAELFSMRVENKWNRPEFEKIWNEACSSNSENKLTVKSIIYWANIDNKEKFKKLTNKDIINTIELDVYNSENRILDGTLYQFQFAHYLNHLFKPKFIYDIDSSGKGKWLEFVLANDSHDAGELYKWREESKSPESLVMYLSNKLPQIINKVILKAEERIKNNPDNEKENEYVTFRTKNLRNSAKDLYKSAFKDGIIKEAENFFRVRGFLKKLNTDQTTMGVGNGVLELSETPKLITDYHTYPISLYTETNYQPYNKNNPNTIRLLKVLLDLFPEDEMDAFHYIMYYLASCLDGKPKDSIILILTGSGSNGKSFFAELVKSVMGQYGAKMAMSFLTESRGKSAGADEQLMLLKNARLAYYSETDKNEVLNTAKLKEITSQETLSGRGIYEKQTNFRPTCSHMVTTNYQFSIKTTDHGIWRRIVTYSFKMKFDDNPDVNNKYEKKNDPTIAKEFSFNTELKTSFLSILVEYYKDLYNNHNGMLKNIMKPTIDKETSDYRNQEDIVNRFIDEYCIYSLNSTICISEMIDKYEMWYENNISKNHVPEKVEISNQLSNSKITKYIKKGMNKVILQNIRLKDDLVEIDELLENEYFIREIINNNKTKEYNYNIDKFNPLGL
jgi:P4 family phage/plasmid primase-like protien